MFGCGAAWLTSPWLPAMIGDYFQMPGLARWPLAGLAWLLGGALYHSAFAAWLAAATRRGSVSPFLVGAAWWALEWLRANAPIPNPWALLGYASMGWTPSAQAADLVGALGVGAWMATTAAAIAGLAAPSLRGPRPRAQGIAVGVLALAMLSYGLLRSQETPSDAPSLRVALVQGAVARSHRYDLDHIADTLRHHVDLTRRAAEQGARLVAWPELALDFYVEGDPGLRRQLVGALEALGVTVLAGGLGVGGDDASPRPTNSVFVISGAGLRGRYDKVRLMPFSESYPATFGLLGDDPFERGAAPQPLDVLGMSFGFAICSEAMHAGHVRRTVLAGAEVLVAPSVDGWFGSAGGARQQLGATAMRAIESRRTILRPTTTGVTAVVDPTGRIAAEVHPGEPGVTIAEIAPATGITVYTRFGDVGAFVAAFAVAADAVVRRRRARSTASALQPSASA